MIPDIDIRDYNYNLPDERIAKYPLEERDSSNLLVYDGGSVSKRIFREIPELLPSDSIMIVNNTMVVPARLHFVRPSGAHIEVLCLEPISPREYKLVFSEQHSCDWKCILGNAKRWKTDTLSLFNPDNDPVITGMNLRASLLEKDGQTGIVRFEWDDGEIFSNVLDIAGNVPIPPYLNRDTEAVDLERYQTTYAHYRGSVAAPTAGLHFTDEVMSAIDSKGIDRRTVCLHVGAGTFLPVKSDHVSEHPMHREPFVVSKELLMTLRDNTDRKVIAVGTTSVRTLESLYYAGVDCIEKGAPSDVEQWAPYTREYKYSLKESLQAIIDYIERNGKKSLKLGTRIIIVPGFKFRVVDILITNFHQPESTLLLLISAFVGGDWKRIYDYALGNGFRFLSYGDSSLLFRRD